MPGPGQQLDPRAPRFNQGVVGVGALVAFVANVPLLVPLLGLLLAAGAFLGPSANPLAILWRHAIVPGLKLGAPARFKEAAPVRFAQLVGFLFLASASVALVLSQTFVAWALTLVVAALALLAAVTDICVGCEIYTLGRRIAARWTSSG
jgi:hypothetical protein